MRILTIILIFLTLIGCNSKEEYSSAQNNRFELITEPNKDLREEHEKLQNDSLKSDTIFEEYLGDRLKPIKENFKRINEIKNWTSIDKRKLNQSSEGGTLTYYLMQDSLLKIVELNYKETGKSLKEFYIQNKLLSFVLEQKYQYNRPINWDSTAMEENSDTETFDINDTEIIEDRSYFENGKLIRQINNQDCGSPFAEDYLKEEQVRLKTEFEKLKERLKNKY